MWNQGYKFFTLWKNTRSNYCRWHYWKSFKSKSYGLKKIFEPCLRIKDSQIICIEHYYVDKSGKHHIDVEYFQFDPWMKDLDELVPVSLTDIDMDPKSFNDFGFYTEVM